MPKPGKLEKATLVEMWPGDDNRLDARNKEGGPPKKVTVQFNPQTLKVSLTNQNAGGDQPGGGASQFVGQGTTKLGLELWFDALLPLPEGVEDPAGDVRNLTRDVAYFMTPQRVTRDGETGLAPPGVQFLWGSFLFKGIVDGMDETLEHFSEDGRPLRAMVALKLSKQDLIFEFGTAAPGPAGVGAGSGMAAPAGTTPLAPAREGETVQQLAARSGARDWKAIAQANGIENPRILPTGKLLNTSGGRATTGPGALPGSIIPGR